MAASNPKDLGMVAPEKQINSVFGDNGCAVEDRVSTEWNVFHGNRRIALPTMQQIPSLKPRVYHLILPFTFNTTLDNFLNSGCPDANAAIRRTVENIQIAVAINDRAGWKDDVWHVPNSLVVSPR